MNTIVVGLGFGDEGKGTTTDYLCRRDNAKAVVRYNGGPQAGHQVVVSDGKSHVFTQFGSGTFVPGVRTHLSSQMLVHIFSLVDEEMSLREQGVTDAFERLSLDPNCRMVMPYHALICRMREAARGEGRFGTTGTGVGEAVMDWRERGEVTLQVKDIAEAKSFRAKAMNLWHEYCEFGRQIIHESGDALAEGVYNDFMGFVDTEEMVERPLRFADANPHCFVSDQEHFADYSDNLVFEGAQGTMLHERWAFTPHVTKSAPLANTAKELMRNNGAHNHQPTVVGALRAYSTRHGHGPFVTEEDELYCMLMENQLMTNVWNGNFRVGWLDLVMTRYAIELNGWVDYISLCCLDRLAYLPEIRICTSYEYWGQDRDELDEFFDWSEVCGKACISRIKEPYGLSRERIIRRTELIRECRPYQFANFEPWSNTPGGVALPREMRRFIDFIGHFLGVPVGIISLGPTAEDKVCL